MIYSITKHTAAIVLQSHVIKVCYRWSTSYIIIIYTYIIVCVVSFRGDEALYETDLDGLWKCENLWLQPANLNANVNFGVLYEEVSVLPWVRDRKQKQVWFLFIISEWCERFNLIQQVEFTPTLASLLLIQYGIDIRKILSRPGLVVLLLCGHFSGGGWTCSRHL